MTRRMSPALLPGAALLFILAGLFARLQPDLSGWSRFFIHPPHDFKITDALITNFHLPRTSLLMLVAAFAGHKTIFKAYEEAVRQRYRFYSYGDAMLIK